MGPYTVPMYRAPRVVNVYNPSPKKVMGQTFDQILGWAPCTGDVCRLTFHSGAAVLGVYVGLKEKGWISALGWIIGIGEGIAGILDIVSLVKRATGTHPPE